MTTMQIKIIAAVAIDGTIGRGGVIPWTIPTDLNRFYRLTIGDAVVMGRLTHESIGRALSGRVNIVLTRRAFYTAPHGAKIVRGSDSAIRAAESAQAAVLWAIGGTEVYRAFAPLATEMHITRVAGNYGGDALFPADILEGWTLADSTPCAATGDAPACSFEVWKLA